MEVKVGFIGIEEIKPVLDRIALDSGYSIQYYFYDTENEALDLALQAQREVDVILFGGPTPYQMVQRDPRITVPSIYISFDGAALFYGLLSLTHKHGKSIEQVSFDTLTEPVIRQIYDELRISAEGIHICPSEVTVGEELVGFHEELYKTGKTSCAITCLRSTHRQLQKKGIPSIHLLATESALRASIQRAILVKQSDYFRKAQIAVGLIEIEGSEPISVYESQKIQLELHHKLINYAEELQAGLFPIGKRKFVLYMTWGVLEKVMSNFIEELLKDLRQTVEGNVHIGYGVGHSAQTAEIRAKVALQHCNRHPGNQCFITLDDDCIVDLLKEHREKEIYRVDDEKLQNLAVQHKISHIVLQRIIRIAKRLEKQDFTAEELATELNQTPRNIRRTLKELTEKGLAHAIGEEHAGGKGRPKIIYKLLFVD